MGDLGGPQFIWDPLRSLQDYDRVTAKYNDEQYRRSNAATSIEPRPPSPAEELKRRFASFSPNDAETALAQLKNDSQWVHRLFIGDKDTVDQFNTLVSRSGTPRSAFDWAFGGGTTGAEAE